MGPIKIFDVETIINFRSRLLDLDNSDFVKKIVYAVTDRTSRNM